MLEWQVDTVLKEKNIESKKFTAFKVTVILLLLSLLACISIFASCGNPDEGLVSSSDAVSGTKYEGEPVDVSMSDAEMTIGLCTVHGVTAEGGSSITWSSSDSSIASVDKDGRITGSGLGECDITAENEFGRSAVCHVTVKKSAFITIDDGPMKNCPQILRKLKKLDVKATFFVVKTANVAKIRQIHEEGHCVGLHTLSHSFKKCYRSEYSYFSDLEELNDIIEEYTGERTNILRFPGGTSNKVMDRLGMRRMVSGLDDLGYRAFDWNASTLDATPDPITAETAAQNALKNCNHDVNIILMHDKNTTAKAIQIIVNRLTARGYVFDTLDNYADWSNRAETWYEKSVSRDVVPCTSLTLEGVPEKLTIDESFSLSVVINPDKSTDYVRLVSDDPAIASVTLEGTVTGVKEGSTQIRAIASSGQEAVCQVTVVSEG